MGGRICPPPIPSGARSGKYPSGARVNFLSKDIYAGDSETIKTLKDAILRELGHLTSPIVDKAITDQGTVNLLAVTQRKRVQTGPFTLNVADGKSKASGR